MASSPCSLRLQPFATPQPHGYDYVLHDPDPQAPIIGVDISGEAVPTLNSIYAAGPHTFRILHFNDLHGQLSTWDGDQARPLFSHIAGEVSRQRQKIAGDKQSALVFLSSGDEVGGSPYDLLLEQTPPVHAAYTLYSAAGLDAATLGNHDFDDGPESLAQAICNAASFPILCANLQAPAPLREVVFPAALLVRSGLRIGLLGLTTPAYLKLPPECGVVLGDPLTAARRYLPHLRPLCDVLIVLSHLGDHLDSPHAMVIGAGDRELAMSMPAGMIDVILGAHTHRVYNLNGDQTSINGTLICQTGGRGEFLGQVCLHVESNQVSIRNAGLLPVQELPANPDFEARHVQPLMERVAAARRQVIGPVQLDSRYSGWVDPAGSAAGESVLANWLCDGLLDRCRELGQPADLAMIDSTLLRSDWHPQSPLTLRNWNELLHYSDALVLYQSDASRLAALLGDNALRIDYPGEETMPRGFLHFSANLRYSITAGAWRSEAHLQSAELDGRPLADWGSRPLRIVSHAFLRGMARPWEQANPLPLMKIQSWPQTILLPELNFRRLLLKHARKGGIMPQNGARLDGRLSIYRLEG